MAGTLPALPAPNRISITSTSPTMVSTTHSLRRQARSRGSVQRWSIDLGYPRLKRVDAAPLESFIIKQAGRRETFEYTPPNTLVEALGTYSGTVTVNGLHSAGDETIAVSGSSGSLWAGSWVQFADHTKVYKIVADSSTSLTIFPALQEDVADTTAVEYNEPTFTLSFTSDDFSYVFSGAPALFNFELSMTEVY